MITIEVINDYDNRTEKPVDETRRKLPENRMGTRVYRYTLGQDGQYNLTLVPPAEKLLIMQRQQPLAADEQANHEQAGNPLLRLLKRMVTRR